MTDDNANAEKPEPGQICLDWWRELNPEHDNGPARQARAELRRIRAPVTESGRQLDVTAAWEIGAFRKLKFELDKHQPKVKPFAERWIKAQVVCAVVLAHVRESQGGTMAAACAAEGANGPVLAETRFKRLLRLGHDDIAELLDPMVQAVHVLGDVAPVADLGASLLDWWPRRRSGWAQDYWTHQPRAA